MRSPKPPASVRNSAQRSFTFTGGTNAVSATRVDSKRSTRPFVSAVTISSSRTRPVERESRLEQRAKGIRTDPLPEMASLDMGPMNRYQHITSENTRHMIDTLAAEMQEKGIKPEMEVFNNGHMSEVYRLIDKGLLEEPYYINIIFGPGTLTPPTPENMVNMVNNLPDNSIFNVLAIGRHQLPLTTMGIVMGGHVRVGMEDNLYYRRGEPAESNAQLVGRTVRIADELDRELATPAEARELLEIPGGNRTENGSGGQTF